MLALWSRMERHRVASQATTQLLDVPERLQCACFTILIRERYLSWTRRQHQILSSTYAATAKRTRNWTCKQRFYSESYARNTVGVGIGLWNGTDGEKTLTFPVHPEKQATSKIRPA
jgi:hypothetical protein